MKENHIVSEWKVENSSPPKKPRKSTAFRVVEILGIMLVIIGVIALLAGIAWGFLQVRDSDTFQGALKIGFYVGLGFAAIFGVSAAVLAITYILRGVAGNIGAMKKALGPQSIPLDAQRTAIRHYAPMMTNHIIDATPRRIDSPQHFRHPESH